MNEDIFDHLLEGDLVAWGFVAFFVLVFALFGLVWWIIVWNMKREDEADRKRRKRYLNRR